MNRANAAPGIGADAKATAMILEVIAVMCACVWLYVAIVAALKPTELARPLWAVFPWRQDTVAAVCFAVSAAACLAARVVVQRRTNAGLSRRAFAEACLRTLLVYSGLVAVYLCANAITHPSTLDMPLTHFMSWPTEAVALATSMICVAASFIVLRSLENRRRDGLGNGSDHDVPSTN
jgi:hypothetical protein